MGKFNYSNGRNSFWDLTKAAGKSKLPPHHHLYRLRGAVSHHHPQRGLAAPQQRTVHSKRRIQARAGEHRDRKSTSLISQQFPLPDAGGAQVGHQMAAEAIGGGAALPCPSPTALSFFFFSFFQKYLGCATWRVVSWFLTRDQICAPLQWKCGVLTTGLPGKSPYWPLIPNPPKHFTKRFLNSKISGRREMEEAGPRRDEPRMKPN